MGIVRESLNEFERGQDPKRSMGIGKRQEIEKDLEKMGYNIEDVEILPDFTILLKNDKKSSSHSYGSNLPILDIQLKYMPKEKAKLVNKILDSKISIKLAVEDALDERVSPKDIKILIDEFGTIKDKERSHIILSKVERTQEEESYDDDTNIYVFIGFRDKVPVEVNGEKYYKDRLGIETLIKIDKYDPAQLSSVNMMNIRARAQYNDGAVYMIQLPKDFMDEDRYDPEDIPEWIYPLIDEKKKKIV